MKKAVVTGGAGFIGQNLCRRLLSEGFFVIAVDNLITSEKSVLNEFKKNKKFIFLNQDIVKGIPASLNKKKINVIFHLACPTGVDNLEKLGAEMLFTSSIGTKNVLDFAKKNKSILVFASSSEIYGNPKVFPQREDYNGNVNPVGYRSTYEEGKRFAESLVSFYARKYKVDGKIVRIFNTYGPGMSRSDSRVIPKFMSLCLQSKDLTVEGKGIQSRTFCFVDDLVEGLILVSMKGKRGEVYNLGSDQEVKIIDLAKKVLIATNSPKKINFINRPKHDHDRRLPDLTRIQKLGWKSKVGLDEGLRRSAKWYGF